MTDEEVIRSEAVQAVEYWDMEHSFEPASTISNLQSELQRFYASTSKAIFLDEVLIRVNEHLQSHQKECDNPSGCRLEPTIQKLLFFIRQEISQLPQIIHKNTVSNVVRDTVFISYSHVDRLWLDMIARHFKSLKDRIEFWEDSQITPGQKWEEEIKNAISRAKVALLLVSADFFGSEFITKKEIPPLLKAAEEDGATILFLVLKPCMIEEYPQILQYQGVNAPDKPFIRMDEADREDLCVGLAKQILSLLPSKK